MTSLVTSVTNFASYLTVIADVAAIILFVILVSPLKNRGGGKKIAAFFGDNAILLAFIVALSSVIGSLFFSEIAQYQPCLLCWWQRIFLYPQAIILLVALFSKKEIEKEAARKYSLVLASLGSLVSLYHTYIQFGGTAIGDCGVTGVSCEHLYFLQYGYVTIPTMALTASLLIILLLCFKKRTT